MHRSNFKKQKRFQKNSDICDVGDSDHKNITVTTLRSQLVTRNVKIKLKRDYKPYNVALQDPYIICATFLSSSLKGISIVKSI